MKKRLSIALTIIFIVGIISSPILAQQSPSVSSDYVKNFFGAVHLNPQYHSYANLIGIRWGRQGAQWDKVEPMQGQFDFEAYDKLINSAKAHNIENLTVLTHSAPWASSAPKGVDNRNKYPPKKEMVSAWKDYIETVVKRHPEVQYFEVWNEPNIDWFLHSDQNYKIYVDRILKPAAEVIHKYGRKVVGLSFTTEWPLDSWPPHHRPRKHSENVQSNIEAMNRWLSYHDAWKSVDILSFHYTHGDVDRKGNPNEDNMMAFYDYLYKNWIKTGKLEGVWDTEEGFAGVEAGMQGFVSLDWWEDPPLGQWGARYTIPVLHWAIKHDWQMRDQYKVFWYHMSVGHHPRNMLKPTTGDTLALTQTSKAMKTIIHELSSGDSLGVYSPKVKVGFGIRTQDTTAINYFAPYYFKNYAFTQDHNLFIASWLNLPGMKAFGQPVQVKINGLKPGRNIKIQKINYLTGESSTVSNYQWLDNGTLFVKIAPTDDPVLYLRILRE